MKIGRWVVGAGIAVVLVASVWQATRHTSGKIRRQEIEAAAFPKDVPAGDAQGVLRHTVWLVRSDGTAILIECHDIPGRDFRRADQATRRQWITDHSLKDLSDAELLACGGPAEWPFRIATEASAQPHCPPDGCGGGCPVVNCPATSVLGDGCSLGGDTCEVTLICCHPPCLCQ